MQIFYVILKLKVITKIVSHKNWEQIKQLNLVVYRIGGIITQGGTISCDFIISSLTIHPNLVAF